jgi:hypothetical protein
MAPGRKVQSNFPPFYASAADESGESFGYSAALNLVRHNREGESVYTHCIPFYFHSRDGKGDSFTLVPPFYLERERAFESDRFFLLFGTQTRGSRHDLHLLFPLIRYSSYKDQQDRWRALLFPLLDLTRDGERHHLTLVDFSFLLGLFTLLDLEWGIPTSEEDDSLGSHYSFFSVLNMLRLVGGRSAGEYRDFELLTLFSSEKLSLYQHHWSKEEGGDGRTVLFPVYWHFRDDEGEAIHLWPLYGWERDGSGTTKHHALYPLLTYMRNESKAEWGLDFPWPLVRILRAEGGDHETRLLPLFWSFEREGKKLLTFPPFYASYENGEGFTRRFYTPLLGTFEGPGEEEWGVDLLYPLLSWQRSKEYAHERIFPLYWRTRDEESHIMEVTPLFWHYRNQEGYAFDLLFPLFSHFGFGEDDHTYSVLPLFKLIADRPKQEVPGRTQVDFLWPLINYGSLDARKVAWFFPFFNYESDKELVHWQFLFNIFGMKTKGSRKTLTLFWLIPISWGGDEESHSTEEES